MLEGIILPFGVAIAEVELIDCRPISAADSNAACIEVSAPGFAWVLKNARPIEHVPVRGMLAIFNLDISITYSDADASPPQRQLSLFSFPL
jgi:hypothetical protein